MDERSLLDRVVKAARLFDAYGGLLTPKQREVLELHYFQDLSLGEIASAGETTRQAVHDLARRALQRLERYEEKLGLVARAQAARARLTRLQELAAAAGRAVAAARAQLDGGEAAGALLELDGALATLERLREGFERWEE